MSMIPAMYPDSSALRVIPVPTPVPGIISDIFPDILKIIIRTDDVFVE